MADCYMYHLKGLQFAVDNCRKGEMRMCEICCNSGCDFEDRRKTGFTCEAHGRWVTGAWLLANYPAMGDSNRYPSSTRLWVCLTHFYPEDAKRQRADYLGRQEADKQRAKNAEIQRQSQMRAEERRQRLRAEKKCIICEKPLGGWDLFWKKERHGKCPRS